MKRTRRQRECEHCRSPREIGERCDCPYAELDRARALLTSAYRALAPFAKFSKVMEAHELKVRAARKGGHSSYGNVLYGIAFKSGSADLRRSDCARAKRLREKMKEEFGGDL